LNTFIDYAEAELMGHALMIMTSLNISVSEGSGTHRVCVPEPAASGAPYFCQIFPKQKLRFPGHQISWVSE